MLTAAMTSRSKDGQNGLGPDLETYVETRLNLLLETLKERAGRQEDSVAALAESFKAREAALKASIEASREADDLRYQQRFEAQSDALAAAFLSQQTAMATALSAAKEAVAAALSAADRAVSKAELAADKRFEALNELRQMLNDMVVTLFPRTEAVQRFDAVTDKIGATNLRIDTLEGRFNVAAGGQEGNRRAKDDSRLWVGLLISAGVALLLLARYFGGR